MTAATLISPEEYLDLVEASDSSFEYDQGRVIDMPRASQEHSLTQGITFAHFYDFARKSGTPLALSQNIAFVILPEVERAPDVAVTRLDKFEAMAVYRGARLGCPDLAVEIVSPNDKAAELELKVRQYLQGGASAVWTLYIEPGLVFVHRSNGEYARLGAGQFVEEPLVAPGLKIPVEDLFSIRPIVRSS